MRDAQADVQKLDGSRDSAIHRLRAQLAFKNSMVHGILQFTPSIAFCYVLHRCVSRDIRCRESFMITKKPRPMSTPQTGHHGTGNSSIYISLAHPVPGFCYVKATTKKTQKAIEAAHQRCATRIELTSDPSWHGCCNMFTGRSALQASTMILPQVHLRKPCYDFSFL